MKVNNLLKRIGSVVTTAAMLATLGTTGFAADPTPCDGSLKGNKITITDVTRTDEGNGVYSFKISYNSGEAANQNSIGVTMLAYVYIDRDAAVSVGTAEAKTAYDSNSMQIVGINQETQDAQDGSIEFSVATSEDTETLKSTMVMQPGQKGLVMIGGDNTTPAIAEFSIPATSWTIASATVASSSTLSNFDYNTSVEDINKAVFAYIDRITAKDSTEAKTAALTKKTGTDDKFSSITITDKDSNNYTAGKVGDFIVTIPLSNFDIPADSGATIGTDYTSVTVNIKVNKDSWKATNATVNGDNKISVAKGTNSGDIIDKIKAAAITIDNGGETDAKKSYTLIENDKNSLNISVSAGSEGEDTATYTVSEFGTYFTDTAEITTETSLSATVTVTFTQNIASEVKLVSGNDEAATDYIWDKTKVSIKYDAETADNVIKAVEEQLKKDNVYAKITYSNTSVQGGATNYKYVSPEAFGTSADINSDKVTAIVNADSISIPSGVTNQFEFGYTVTPVLETLDLSATIYNYTKKADVEAEDTIKANITTELNKLTITEDGHTVNVADTERTWTITFGANGTYTATLKVTKFNDTTFDAWMPTAGYIEATVTGTISEKPAEAFTAKLFGAYDKEVSVGTAKADVISSLPTTATAYENADKIGTSATVKVENWTSSDYDPGKIGEYTFTATVPVQETEEVKVTEAGTVSIKVTTTAVSVNNIASVTTAVSVPEGYNEGAVKAVLPQKLTYTSGTLTDTVDVSWTGQIGLGKTKGNTFNVTGEVAGSSDNGLFKFDPKGVTATVSVTDPYVVKAWEVSNSGVSSAASVKVYLPVTAKIGEKVTASLYKSGEEDAFATAEAMLEKDYNADNYNSVTLTFEKAFSDLEMSAGDEYSVKVKIGGKDLKYNDGEEKDKVSDTVASSSSRRKKNNSGGTVTPEETKSYAVSVKSDSNGTASVDKTKAEEGDTVTVSAEPKEGYKVKEITVKDVNGKSIDVDQKAKTFTMPAAAVTVSVTFEEGEEEPKPDDKGEVTKFKDVPDTFWAAADIYTLKEAGIIEGRTEEEFDPEGEITRAEYTKMIVKMFGVEVKDADVEFKDCGDGDWFTPYIAAALGAGYVEGYSDTEFGPNKIISREEACAILGRAYAKTANQGLSFKDTEQIDEYAKPYVALLVEMGFIDGYEDGTFRAQKQITRAEASKIIACAYRLAISNK